METHNPLLLATPEEVSIGTQQRKINQKFSS